MDEAVHAMSGPASVQMLFNLAAGLACGALIGMARYRNRESGTVFKTDLALVVGAAIVGLAAGWQSVLAIGLFFSIVLTGLRLMELNQVNVRPKQLLVWLAATILWLVFWKGLVEPGLIYLPGPATPLWQIPVWMVFLTIPMVVSLASAPNWPEYVPPVVPIEPMGPEFATPGTSDCETPIEEVSIEVPPPQPSPESPASPD
jgi:hypothetical protein